MRDYWIYLKSRILDIYLNRGKYKVEFFILLAAIVIYIVLMADVLFGVSKKSVGGVVQSIYMSTTYAQTPDLMAVIETCDHFLVHVNTSVKNLTRKIKKGDYVMMNMNEYYFSKSRSVVSISLADGNPCEE